MKTRKTIEVTCTVCGDSILFSLPLSKFDKERMDKDWFVCLECD